MPLEDKDLEDIYEDYELIESVIEFKEVQAEDFKRIDLICYSEDEISPEKYATALKQYADGLHESVFSGVKH